MATSPKHTPLIGIGLLAVSALSATACIGTHGDTPDPLELSGTAQSCSETLALSAPLSRLNQRRFQQVTSDLFGSGLDYQAKPFPRTLDGPGYSTYANANPLDLNNVKAIMEAAESIAMQVVDRVPACSGEEEDCARSYLKPIADRAFRRAASEEELALLLGVYNGARQSANHAESVGMAVAALLQTPQFLNLLEEKQDGSEEALDGAAIAQRMSMQLWNSLPDEQLLQAANKGELSDPEIRRQQARRMLADPRSEKALLGFLEQWLHLNDLGETPFSTEVLASLREELKRNLQAAIASPDGFGQLLRSNKTVVNSVLEDFYDLPTKSNGPSDWVQAELDPERRVGILTHPLLMTRFAHGDRPSAVLRGHFISTVLMCNNIAPPPPGATAQQATLTPAGATDREKAEARLEHPVCGSCHRLMDPIGFGFDAFDGKGAYLGESLASTIVVASPAPLAGDYESPRSFAETLANSTTARSCFAEQYIRYSLGSKTDAASRCTVDELTATLGSQSIATHDMLIDYIASANFILRRIEP